MDIVLYTYFMDIGVGLSLQKNPILAIKEAISIAKEQMIIKKPDFGILFTSLELSCSSLLRALNEYLGNIPVIGGSSSTILCNKSFHKEGLVLMLVKLPAESLFNIANAKNINLAGNPGIGKEMGIKLLNGLYNKNKLASFFILDTPVNETSEFIFGLREKLGMGFPLLGAFTSGGAGLPNNYIYFNNDLFRNASAGILFAGKLHYGSGCRHGWKPLGKSHLITAGENNIIAEIDDMPAVKIYEDYLNCDLNELKNNLRQISTLYPFGIQQKNEPEYLLRNVIAIEPGGGLRIQGNLPKNKLVRLMIGTKETCIEAAKEAAEQTKIGLSGMAKTKTKKFAIVFSSMARQLVYKKSLDQELAAVNEALGANTPVIGLCPYSGLSPSREINYQGEVFFSNYNISILTIGG